METAFSFLIASVVIASRIPLCFSPIDFTKCFLEYVIVKNIHLRQSEDTENGIRRWPYMIFRLNFHEFNNQKYGGTFRCVNKYQFILSKEKLVILAVPICIRCYL